MPLLLVIVGLIVGAALGWLAARARSAAEVARLDATLRATRDGEVRLEQALRALSHEAVRDQQSSLTQLLTPLREAIHRYERRVVEVENDRVDAYAELRTEEPLLPISLFRNRVFAVSALITLITGVAMMGSLFYIPLFVQGVIGRSATNSGLVTMPMMISMAIASGILDRRSHSTRNNAALATETIGTRRAGAIRRAPRA